jgi:hypothetical protein
MRYTFKKTKQPTPGTGDLSFIPAFSLPALGFIGPGIGVVNQLFPLQTTPQVYYTQSLVQDGLQGIPAGSMGQPGLENLDDILSQWSSGASVA